MGVTPVRFACTRMGERAAFADTETGYAGEGDGIGEGVEMGEDEVFASNNTVSQMLSSYQRHRIFFIEK